MGLKVIHLPNERIKFLKSEDDAAVKQPSLELLLGSPERNYLISNKGDRVPIHTLKDKVVALYFFEDGLTDDGQSTLTDRTLTDKLEVAYKDLAKMNKNFEAPTLVVIGPNCEFIDPCGVDILMHFGIPAYPFTRKNIAKLETEKAKELKLEMFWDRNTIFKVNKDDFELPESNALHFGSEAGRGGELLKLKSPVELSDE
ncbi:hypothetical protein OROMI_019124 [Orobanche minor]